MTPTPDPQDRRVQLTIFLFCGVLLATIVASIHLSTLGLNFGTLVYGPRNLWQGHDAALRIAAIEPVGMRYLDELHAELTVRDEQGVRYQGAASGKHYTEHTFTVPADLGRFPFLDVTVKSRKGEDSFTLAMRSQPELGPLAGHLASTKELLDTSAHGQKVSQTSYQLEPFPHSGIVVGGLENPLALQVLREGQPQANLAVRVDGAEESSRTNALGVAELVYHPGMPERPLKVHLGEAPSIAQTLPLKAHPTGLRLAVEPSGMVPAGTTLEITVHTLPFRDPVHIDVWAQDMLMLATSEPAQNGVRNVEVTLPKQMQGFVRIDAYRNFGAPDDSATSTLLYVHQGNVEEAASHALSTLTSLEGVLPLLAQLRLAEGATVEGVTLLLRRFAPDSFGLPLLHSTLQERQNSVEAEKAALRGHVHTLFVLTTLLGLVLLVGRVVTHQMQTRAAVREVVDEGVRQGEDLDTEGLERLTRVRDTLHLWGTVVAAAFGIYAVYILLTHLWWG